MRVMIGVFSLGLLFNLSAFSCAGAQPYIATQEALKLTSDEFVVTSEFFERGLDAKTVSVEDYRKWSAFEKAFKAGWNLSADLYEAALRSSDKTRQDQAAAILAGFASDLLPFFNAVSAKRSPSDGGT